MRLITFGCSLTYGTGLEDCWENGHNGSLPSKFAWPNEVANRLNRELVNCAVSGSSNKEILYNLQNFNYQDEDMVVVLWSHFDRYCIITEDGIKHINAWQTDKTSRFFYRNVHDFYDMKVDMYTRLNYAHYFLTKRNILNFHAFGSGMYKHDFNWNDVQLCRTSINKIRREHPKALDNSHPGPAGHKEFGRLLYQEIKERINE